MKINFYVGKNDIKHGKRRACQECPVALSVRRRLPNCRVTVREDYVSIVRSNGLNTRQIQDLPKHVTQFIKKFDRLKKSVKPIRFSLDLTESLL
jgi:hypothetical protein